MPKNLILFLFFFIAGFRLSTAKPVGVLLLNEQVDYEALPLAPFIHPELRNRKSVSDLFTWCRNFNYAELYIKTKVIVPQRMGDAWRTQNYFEFFPRELLNRYPPLKDINKPEIFLFSLSRLGRIFRSRYPSRIRNELNNQVTALTQLSHGTTIAEIVTSGISPQELVLTNLPSLTVMLYSLVNGSPPQPSEVERRIVAWAKIIDDFIKEQGIRIVTLTFSPTSPEAAMHFQQMLDLVVAKNPDTIFIYSAGNKSSFLSLEALPLSPAPNVLIVGSINLDAKKSKHSNHSSQLVDIGAWGESVAGLVPGIGHLLVGGTSFATPWVANTLAHIISKDPSISAQQALLKLYSSYTKTNESLLPFFKEGRYLTVSKGTLKERLNHLKAQPSHRHVCALYLRWHKRVSNTFEELFNTSASEEKIKQLYNLTL